jgi:hypothetical protein
MLVQTVQQVAEPKQIVIGGVQQLAALPALLRERDPAQNSFGSQTAPVFR